MTEKEVLDFMNTIIEEENGVPITIDSKYSDASIDSFGTVVFFLELDDKFSYFESDEEYREFMNTADFSTLTIKELVQQCILKSTITENQQ
jgi:acyl carrier protein